MKDFIVIEKGKKRRIEMIIDIIDFRDDLTE